MNTEIFYCALMCGWGLNSFCYLVRLLLTDFYYVKVSCLLLRCSQEQ